MLDFLLLYGLQNSPIPEESIQAFRGQPIGECDFIYNEAMYTLSEGRDRFALFCLSNTSDAHLSLDESGQSIQFFDGTLIQDEAASDIRTLKPISTNHADLHGVYLHGLFSTQGENHLHRDLLGFYPLFFGLSASFYAVSNNPALIAQALYPQDYKKRKNLYPPAALLFSISSWDLNSAYEKVFYWPLNTGLRIDSLNQPYYYALCEKFYEPVSPEDWQPLFETAYEKTLKWGRLTAKQGTAQLSDITGGYDSRLALSIAVKTGTHKSVTWHVHGSEDEPDVIMAKRLAARLDLKLDWTQAATDGTFDAEDSYYTNVRRFLHRVSGGRPLTEMRLINDELSPGNLAPLKFGGSAGEMFKAYFSKWWLKKGFPNQKIDYSNRNVAVKSLLDNSEIISMLKDEIWERFAARVEKRISYVENIYDIDLIYNYTYLPRLHGGNVHRLSTNAPMPVWPGNLPMLHKLTYAMPAEWRAANSMVFTIIDKNCPELLTEPFAGLIWQHPLAYFRRPDAAEIYKLRGVMTPERFEISGPEPTVAEGWLKTIATRYGTEINRDVAELFQKDKLEKYLEPLSQILHDTLHCGQKHIMGLMQFLGLSMFMDGLELAPPANLSGPLATPVNGRLKQRQKTLYSPAPNVYQEAAFDVVCRGDLFFDREKKYGSSNQQKLEGTEKLIVELLREIPSSTKKA